MASASWPCAPTERNNPASSSTGALPMSMRPPSSLMCALTEPVDNVIVVSSSSSGVSPSTSTAATAASTPAVRSASACTRCWSSAMTPANPRNVTDAAIARAESRAISHSTVTNTMPRRRSSIVGLARIGCGRRHAGRRIALRTSAGGVGTDDELGGGQQIRTRIAIAQDQFHEPRQARLPGPGVAPGHTVILAEPTKFESNENVAFQQNDRVTQSKLLEPRAWPEPGGTAPNQTHEVAVLLGGQRDNFLSALVGSHAATTNENEPRWSLAGCRLANEGEGRAAL